MLLEERREKGLAACEPLRHQNFLAFLEAKTKVEEAYLDDRNACLKHMRPRHKYEERDHGPINYPFRAKRLFLGRTN